MDSLSAGVTSLDSIPEALEDVAGVRSVKPTGLTLMSKEVEYAVTVSKGKLNAQALAKALSKKTGLKGELEPVETWCLSASCSWSRDRAVKPPSIGTLTAPLGRVEGVTAVAVTAAQELQVSGYVPHLSTAQLLNALKALGWEASVQTEQVGLKVKGAETPEQLEKARAKLAQAPGVVEAKADKSGGITLVREKGRGSIERLNRALHGTGYCVELSG